MRFIVVRINVVWILLQSDCVHEQVAKADCECQIYDIKEGFVEDYIPLPGQYDINEYRIMEEFIYELPAGKNQDVLARTLQGRGAFRRFKDKLYDLNLEKHWYQYREEAYEKIARQWCERHKIDIVE